MPRLTAVILFSLISLVSGLQAGQGFIIVFEEEHLGSGQKTQWTLYLEPDRVAFRGTRYGKLSTMVYLADEKVFRIIDHQNTTVREITESDMKHKASQMGDALARARQMTPERMGQMPSAANRYGQAPPQTIYSRGDGSSNIGGQDCDWYVGRRGEEMVASVCTAPWGDFDFNAEDFQVFRQVGEFFRKFSPGAADQMSFGAPDPSDPNKYPGVLVEQTRFSNGQAVWKNTMREYRHDEIDAGVYAAPSGYFDLTCRDEGLCS